MNIEQANQSAKWVVLKFGGTSVSDHAVWHNILKIVTQYRNNNEHLLIVCSAPKGISNELSSLIDKAIQQNYQQCFKKVESIYQNLAEALQLNFKDLLQNDFSTLRQLVEGISLINEATPRVQAKILSFGELMLTKLGVAFLKAKGADVNWVDARELLQTQMSRHVHNDKSYLRARCDSDFDATLLSQINKKVTPILMTQGFIARNHKGETVLLGRGGSDTSAAYLSAKLNAKRCEIWTDVPGVYTANPHLISEARLLKCLDYDEAQEIASMGAKVLHPHCIPPLKQSKIPLHIKYTPDPNREGTIISQNGDAVHLPIKSILTKYGVTLITIETISMWQEIGFLANIFQCFKQHGISVDLITTSESSVTVSLDSGESGLSEELMDALLEDLNQFSDAYVIGPCAAISLVGRHIRSILHQLGGIFSIFESHRIHLLSQAANDLNLTFVVNEDQAQRLAQRLHALLIEQTAASHYYTRSWKSEFGKSAPTQVVTWWQEARDTLLALTQKKSPLYVYSHACLMEAVSTLKNCHALDKVYYSVKANPNQSILNVFYQNDLGFECVSIHEVEWVLQLFPKIDRNRILFTPNFAAREEYEKAFRLSVQVTVDSLYPLEHWSSCFENRSILVRIDPGRGYGHHKYVVTGGNESKFGISVESLPTLKSHLQKYNIKLIGLHAHGGSGILDATVWAKTFEFLTTLLKEFPDVSIINLGGGLGIVEKPGQRPIDMHAFNNALQKIKSAYPNIALWMEPGRYLVARAGVLLAHVTQLKRKGHVRFVGIETGMNSLIRPMLYGSYHEIVNLTRLDDLKSEVGNVVGPICESGDILGYSRLLPPTKEGDVLLIANTGAYGYCMRSQYNLRPPAEEYFLD